MEQNETKELAVTQSNLPVQAGVQSGMDASISASDIVIPRMSLMQGLSDAVAESRAQMGDILNSTSGEKLGDKNTPFFVIPLKIFKSVVASDISGSKPKFYKEFPWSQENEQKAFGEPETVTDEEGVTRKLRYDRAINCYVLLAREVEEGMAMPILVSFRRTSYMAGRRMISHFAKANAVQKPPFCQALQMGSSLEKNDQGTYYTFLLGAGRKATQDELAMAQEWSVILQKGNVKVAETEVVQTQAPASGAREIPADDLPY